MRAQTDGHIWVVRAPHRSWWTDDYEHAYQIATGVDSERGGDDHERESDIRIMHNRQSGYVLDMSDDPAVVDAQECCTNRGYECGHWAFGPPLRLPDDCPECNAD